MRRIGICVARWLNYSETFIYHQTKAISSFETVVLSLQSPDAQRFPHPLVRSLHVPHAGLLCGRRAVPRFVPRLDLLLVERIARREKVSLLHAHYGTVGCYFLEVARRVGCPLVVTFHGRDASRNLGDRTCLERYRKMWAEAGIVVAVSERIRERLIGAGCPGDKTQVVHTGVLTQQMRYRDPSAAPRNGPVIVACVGRLIEKKGHRFLLEAVARLRSEGRDLRLRVIGDGPLLDSLRRLASDLGICEAVAFEGAQSHSYVNEALRQAHVFALASVTAADGDEEGIPVVLMEAMAAGVPVVSTWHAGIPELVEDGISGLLAQPGDAEGFADRLGMMLDEPGLGQSLARAARQRVEEHFDTVKETGRLEALYAGLLGS